MDAGVCLGLWPILTCWGPIGVATFADGDVVVCVGLWPVPSSWGSTGIATFVGGDVVVVVVVVAVSGTSVVLADVFSGVLLGGSNAALVCLLMVSRFVCVPVRLAGE